MLLLSVHGVSSHFRTDISPARARIRGFAANILRANKVANISDTRYRNALDGLDHLAKYKLM